MFNVDNEIPGLTSVVTTSNVRAVDIGSSEIIASLHTVCIGDFKIRRLAVLYLVSF